MKKIFIILFLLTSFCFSEDWTETFDIWYDFGHTAETDSIYLASGGGIDSLVIWGAESVNIFIPIKKSNGIICIWGIVTNVLGGISDTVFFDIAPHRGTPDATRPGFTPSYVRLDTASMTSGNSGSFVIYPMSSSTLRKSFSSYIDFKMTGINNSKRYLYIKVEWLQIK